MHMNPLLSVIIPVYNAEKRLVISLSSILGQTYQNLEVIMVDDGSADNSYELMKEYAEKDSRIKIFSQKNSGVSASRNLGIEKASGELITFFDADDVLEPDTYEEAIRYYVENDLDVVMYGLNYEYYDGEELVQLTEYSLEKNLLIEQNELNGYFVDLYHNKYIPPVWNKIFCSEVIKDNDLYFNTALAVLEDMEYVINYLEKAERIGVLSESYVHYYHDLAKHAFKRRASIDYLTGFKALDNRVREFCRNMNITDDKSLGYINSVIFEFYLVHIKKLFVNETAFKYKYQKLREFVDDKDVQKAVRQAVPVRKNIKLMKFLVQRKMNLLLYITINSWVRSIK